MFSSVAGMLPFFMIMLAMHANVKVPKLPVLFLPVFVGTLLAWIQRQPGVVAADAVSKSLQTTGFFPCRFALEALDSFNECSQYLTIIFPVALTVAVGTIQCRESAAKVGDEYNLRWS